MSNYVYKINFEKYPLLRKVGKEYLNTILEYMFDNGYNNYIRNLIRNDNNNNMLSNITENKISSTKGQAGETVVYEILIDKFKDYIIENTTKIPHSGDIQVTLPKSKSKIIVEVKNYNKTVDQGEIDKLKFDMKFNKINYGIMISLNSGIVGKKRFQFESFFHDDEYYYILYVPYAMHKIIPTKKNIIIHNSYEESIMNLTVKLEFCLCIMVNLSMSIIKTNHSHINYYNIDENVSLLINELEKVFDEFLLVKQSALKMEENIKKSLEINSQNIKDFENGIKNRINFLINLKINNNYDEKIINNKEKFKILIYEENHWNIFFNNIVLGKIIKFKNTFDIFLIIKQKIFNEQFHTYEKVINYLNFIINNEF